MPGAYPLIVDILSLAYEISLSIATIRVPALTANTVIGFMSDIYLFDVVIVLREQLW